MTTLTDKVAEVFRCRPGQWIDGHVLADTGGYAGYRTRVSELRYSPYSMVIRNRTLRVLLPDGRRITESSYMYLPEDRPNIGGTPTRDLGSECACGGSGWREVSVDGVARLARCPCRGGRVISAARATETECTAEATR